MATLVPTRRKRRQSQAWCFKPLLRERRSGIYVHERREVIHVQKEVAPCILLQGLRRNWQETKKIAKTTMSPAPCQNKPLQWRGSEDADVIPFL